MKRDPVLHRLIHETGVIMQHFQSGRRSLTLAAAAVLWLAVDGSSDLRAATVVGNVYQDIKAANCGNLTHCPVFFGKPDANLRVTSVSCSIAVAGSSSYPDLISGMMLLQQGRPERLFLGHVAIQRYTETEVVYQLLVTQPNFGIAGGKRPMIQIDFSSAPVTSTANCAITGEFLP